jgi:IS5 family transposase
MPWAEIESSLAPLFAHRARPGRVVSDADLFGATSELVGAGVSKAGRPRLPRTRGSSSACAESCAASV